MKLNAKSSISKTLLSSLICGVLALTTVDLQAAKRPMSKKALEKKAHYIISGNVMTLTSKVQKSKVERVFGIHRDRVYTINLKVASVSKGVGVKVGQEILIELAALNPYSARTWSSMARGDPQERGYGEDVLVEE